MPRRGPVFPVLPSYYEGGGLDLARTASYVRYLEEQGSRAVMTTAGTTQFNLLSPGEILELNACVADNFSGSVILGAPPLAEHFLIPFLSATVKRHSDAALLLLYPERLYRQGDVVRFFEVAAQFSPSRIYVHGSAMRLGSGGVQDFNETLIREMVNLIGNMAGMKEECSSYEAGFKLCAGLTDLDDFEIIVAGGSMRRFLLLQAAGAQSFLAGVGSLYPSLELSFFRHVEAGNLKEASLIISELETPVFTVFMEIGWHKALRYAAKCLGLIGPGERRPMPEPVEEERRRIDASLLLLENNSLKLSRQGVL